MNFILQGLDLGITYISVMCGTSRIINEEKNFLIKMFYNTICGELIWKKVNKNLILVISILLKFVEKYENS